MKIRVIAPVILEGPTPPSVQQFARMARPDCEVEVVFLDRGPASIESEYEEALAAPDTIAKAKEGEETGADAIVVDCMLDPGLEAARERVSIPVVGPAQVSMHMAAMLSHRFSIVTVVSRLISPFYKLARTYGVSDYLGSVRAIEVPVLELERDQQATVTPLVEQASRAIEEDGSQAIVFGCTGMAGLARAVEDGLRARGYAVPVIDPGVAALKTAEVLVDLRLAHSKLAYPIPPVKALLGYPQL
jgi:allantoin racemase